jgi:hypothetical protein
MYTHTHKNKTKKRKISNYYHVSGTQSNVKRRPKPTKKRSTPEKSIYLWSRARCMHGNQGVARGRNILGYVPARSYSCTSTWRIGRPDVKVFLSLPGRWGVAVRRWAAWNYAKEKGAARDDLLMAPGDSARLTARRDQWGWWVVEMSRLIASVRRRNAYVVESWSSTAASDGECRRSSQTYCFVISFYFQWNILMNRRACMSIFWCASGSVSLDHQYEIVKTPSIYRRMSQIYLKN